MKLYYSKGACSLAIRILIHELNLSCEYESVNLKEKKTENGIDFFTINPKGAVPVLVVEDDQILTEGSAIHQYLADKYHAETLFPKDFQRYRVIEWLNFVSTELHKGFSPLFNSEISEEVKDKVFLKNIKNKLKIVDKQLENHQYLTADHYTLPDGYLFTILRWAVYFKVDFQNFPNLSRYYTKMNERPSVKQSLQEEGLRS